MAGVAASVIQLYCTDSDILSYLFLLTTDLLKVALNVNRIQAGPTMLLGGRLGFWARFGFFMTLGFCCSLGDNELPWDGEEAEDDTPLSSETRAAPAIP